MAKIVKLEKISLKNSMDYNEKLIQDYIFENPSILGLGDLSPLQKEKTQPTGGRLDMLFADDANTRYEVEIQLGGTDPHHIIRTIEYWDTERKRYPQYDHCAVIIAEEITGRFLNVISLFNGHIPLIALQVSAHKTGEKEISMIFTKVLDRVSLGADEEEVLEPTDRKYWEKRSSPKMLAIVDKIFNEINKEDEKFTLKYNKFYIGLASGGMTKNFVIFEPKRKYIKLQIKGTLNEELNTELDDAGLEISYDNRWKQYAIRINEFEDYSNNREAIEKLVSQAKEYFNI